MALTNKTWLGMITPLGGALFITAWILFAIEISKKRKLG